MARITVEDCLEKTNSQYDLVLLAKERTSQLNDGEPPLVPKDNDKNTVIALREIGEGKVSVKTLEDSAINKHRKHHEGIEELEELEDDNEDNFDKIYKGEISKSGTAILPSKRVRRIPETQKIEIKNSIDSRTDKEKEIDKEKQIEPETLPADNKSEK